MSHRLFLILFFYSSYLFCQDSSAAPVYKEEVVLKQENILYHNKINNTIYYSTFNKLLQENEHATKAMLQVKAMKIAGIIDTPNEGSSTVKKPGDRKTVKRLVGPSQYDSRIEPLQLDIREDWQNNILLKTESVGMIIEIEKLTAISKLIYQIDVSQKLGTINKLCAGSPFFSQPIAGSGTSFIFGEDTVLTALHVLQRPLKYYAIVFGYKVISQNGVVDVFIDKNNIYYPKKIVRKLQEFDVVELKVDRKFNRPILQWEESKKIDKNNNEIYMLGYPNGLPLKLSINASILENTHPFFYYTSLDGFQGNSGSPVFNFYSNKVIGILVSGGIDYKFNGTCNYLPHCKYPFCKGEKIIRIETVAN